MQSAKQAKARGTPGSGKITPPGRPAAAGPRSGRRRGPAHTTCCQYTSGAAGTAGAAGAAGGRTGEGGGRGAGRHPGRQEPHACMLGGSRAKCSRARQDGSWPAAGAHRAVPARHHPGRGGAVNGRQIGLNEGVLRAARRKIVLCTGQRRRGGGVRGRSALSCRGHACNRCGTRGAGKGVPQTPRHSDWTAARPPVENCRKWMGPKSKEYQGWSSAGVGMPV